MGEQSTRIKIGVTGHRYLHDLPGMEAAIREVFEKITSRYPGQSLMHYNPLAPGADQLTAQIALQKSIPLTVLLPLTEEDYLLDFPEEAIDPFYALVKQAEATLILPGQPNRLSAYQALGAYLVEQMDLLIAVWNGQPARGPGGTGEVVGHFRQSGKPLAWIRADNDLPDGPISLPSNIQQCSIAYENW